jgi:hypothetical protein
LVSISMPTHHGSVGRDSQGDDSWLDPLTSRQL